MHDWQVRSTIYDLVAAVMAVVLSGWTGGHTTGGKVYWAGFTTVGFALQRDAF